LYLLKAKRGDGSQNVAFAQTLFHRQHMVTMNGMRHLRTFILQAAGGDGSWNAALRICFCHRQQESTVYLV
jgi:hypothetical protein